MTGHVILLNVQDTTYDPGFRTEYLAFGYLAAALRAAGHRVTWIDEHTDSDLNPETYDFSVHGRVDVVAVSPSFATYRRILSWLAAWRKAFPQVLTVMGGQHAMMVPGKILKDGDLVDAVCLGEGEQALADLVECHLSGAQRLDVAGFAHRGGGMEPRAQLCPMDELPFPHRDTLERWIRSRTVTQVALQNSRGCPYNCNFCHLPQARKNGQGYSLRVRTPANVVREMVGLTQRYGYREFFFCSPQFGGKGQAGRDWMRQFADLLIAEGRDIRFEIECRADSLDDEELIAHLRRAGLIRVFIGLEAGTDEGLRGFGKGLAADQLERVVALLQGNGVSISGSGFIMFHPESTLQSLEDNAGFLARLGECHVNSLWSFFRALPGIRTLNRLEERGLVSRDRPHDAALAYRFEDPRVASLHAGMPRALDAPSLNRAMRAMRLIDIEIGLEEANLPAVAPWVDAGALADLLDLRAAAHTLRGQVAAAMHDHFLHCIRLTRRGEADFALAGQKLERNLRGLGPKIDGFLARHDAQYWAIVRRSARMRGQG